MYNITYFHKLRQQGLLKEFYPEIYALIGVKQPERWHPEGDAFQHTMLVIEQALQRYPDDSLVYWGAVCHDLGKALTPVHEWPKHYGHARRGLKPTETLLTDLDMERDFISHVQILVEYHMHIHQADQMKDSTYEKIYNDICSRVGKDFAIILISKLAKLGVCDHYGRGNIDPNAHYELPWIFYNKMLSIKENK